MNKKPLVVLGMHRSGTSALSRLLHEDGIMMGEELMPSSHSNIHGHFEDMAFYNFHRKLMADRDMSYLAIKKGVNLDWNAKEKERARALVNVHFKKTQWGWKDPRTAIFLTQWKEIWKDFNIEPTFLISYRDPGMVVQSIVRRDIRDIRKANAKLTSWWSLRKYKKNQHLRMLEYLSSWINHYQAIQNELKNINTSQYKVVHSDKLLHQYKEIQDYLINKGYTLNKIEAKEYYDENIYQKAEKLGQFRNPQVESIHQFFSTKN